MLETFFIRLPGASDERSKLAARTSIATLTETGQAILSKSLNYPLACGKEELDSIARPSVEQLAGRQPIAGNCVE